jgi:glutamate-1-semialdehyde aminotransferase
LKIAEQIVPRGDTPLRNESYYRSIAQEPPVPARNHRLERSRELLARARKVIPTASQTFSKCPTQFIQSTAPNFIARGAGSHVWDVDGNEFIDYPMALGPIILGHNDPDVTAAVVAEMANGTAFSLPHALEVEVAEMLVEMIPCAEMARFGKNGSDVTAGAVRAARAFTGREQIACCGYHGWQDWYIGTTTRNGGVPKAVQELTHPFEYNNLESLEQLFAKFPEQIAAVILEPIGVIEPRADFLPGVAALAKKNGALLIFDEIVTGFRVALGGAQEFFGVTPDLAAFGKAMGNGFPIAAVVGRRDVMEIFDEIFFSFTFGGETAALAAARATMKKLRDAKVIEHIWSKGRQLTDGIRFLANEFGLNEYIEILGQPPRTVFRFKDQAGQESLLVKSYFQQECLRRGILFSGGQNICFAHGDAEIDYTLRVYRTVMEMLRDAFKKGDLASRLEAPMIQPVFRRA